MSAGAFQLSNYETNLPELGGVVMPIRVQPETLGLTIGGTPNAGSTDAIDFPLRVQVSKGRREYGVGARRVTIRFTDQANLPDGYKGDDLTLPVLTTAAFAAFSENATGTYLGSPVQVVSKIPETYR